MILILCLNWGVPNSFPTPMPEADDPLKATRATLLARIKDWGDDQSWREFFEIYWKLVYSTALRAGLDESAARDVVQDTFLTVAKNIREFEYDRSKGSFKGWLLQSTRWRIRDHFRRIQARPVSALPEDEEAANALIDQMTDKPLAEIEAAWDKEWNQSLIDAAFERVKKRVNPKQFQLFDCFVVRGWKMEEVTQRLNVNAGQVYFAKYKVGAMIKKELTGLRKEFE